MNVLIPSAILLLIGISYAILLRRKLMETVFLAVATVVFVLYCFGFLNREGSLRFGIYGVVFLAIISTCYITFAIFRRATIVKQANIGQGMLIFGCLLLIALFINMGRVFQHWDEFSHWGKIVKHFYYLDALGTVCHPNYSLQMPNYLPGTSLFQYFFTRFSGVFKEYPSYIAANVMYFSMVMPFVKYLFTKRKWIGQLLLLISLLILPLLFTPIFYSSLFVDTLLGILFGISILYYFVFQYEKSPYGVLLVSAATFLLVITKSTGVLFAFGVLVIVFADILFIRRKEIGIYINKRKGWDRGRRIIWLLLPLILSGITRALWSILLAVSETEFSAPVLALEDVFRFFSGNLEHYQLEARYSFFLAIFQRRIPGINMSIFGFSVLFVVLSSMLIFVFMRSHQRKRFLLSEGLLFVGFYIYQFFMALMYVYVFGPFEGPRLASFERYMITFIMGMMLFMLLLVLILPSYCEELGLEPWRGWQNNEQKINFKECVKIIRNAGFVVIVVSSFYILLGSATPNLENVFLSRLNQPEYFRPRETAVAAERWLEHFIETPPYFIDQGGNGFHFFRIQFELMPHTRIANDDPRFRWDYSISPTPFFTGDQFGFDPWTFIITPEEWEQYVFERGYETVYIFRSDEILETVFGHFFEGGVQEDMVYYVRNENGNLRLIPVVGD